MLTIICGEDTEASRAHYAALKTKHAQTGAELVHVSKSDLEHIPEIIYSQQSLFSTSRVIVTEQYVNYLKKNRSKALTDTINKIAKDPDVIWLDWESYSKREITNPKSADYREFTPAFSIFQFLENLYPKNTVKLYEIFTKLIETQEPGFIYAMTCRHIRSLLLVQAGSSAPLPSWQAARLRTQADKWNPQMLISFYEGLARIDRSIKTSTNIFGIQKSLELLLIYYV